MDAIRRKLLTGPVLGWLLMKPAQAGWFDFGRNPEVRDIKLNLQDAAGKPIAYASIWIYMRGEENEPDKLRPTIADLWRLANHLRHESYEFVSNSVKPLPQMGVTPMSNNHGVSAQKFPSGVNKAIEAGFVILKRGYLPAKVVTSTVKNPGDLSLTVTLQADPESRSIPAYLEQFDRIRFENTSIDIRDSGQVSSVSSFIEQLNTLADEALRAGDKESAAKMLFYIGYLPSASPGRAQRVDYFSPQAIEARKKAVELRPTNAYIQNRLFGAEGRQFEGIYAARGNTSPERLQAYAEYVERKVVFLDKMGDRAWPTDHATLIFDYRNLGMKDKMNAQILKVRAIEPKLDVPNPEK